MKEAFTFDDVLIVQKFSELPSRSDEYIDLSTNIRSLKFKLPVISANMDTVTDGLMALTMLQHGAQACLHRFTSIHDNLDTFRYAAQDFGASPMVSIGLGNRELERAKALFDAGAHTFVIDVAHGAQLSVAKQVLAFREVVGPYVNLIVGNFSTGQTVRDFLDYVGMAVDGFKIGVGPGSACTTRIKTGVGYPQLSAILDVSNTLKNVGIAIIADGGMKVPGDIAKALGAGAHMAMIGGMLAGTLETPGQIVDSLGNYSNSPEYLSYLKKFKQYRGSASLESYKDQGKEAKHRTAEGESFLVPYKGPVADVLQDIEGGLRSSFGYVGAANMQEYHGRVEFVRVSSSTVRENGAHGKSQ
jgi:IMP dehydrogenase